MFSRTLTRRAIGSVLSTRSVSRLSAALGRGAPIDIHPEVKDALATKKPVVALETALTTHGLPPPINLQVTKDLEAVVRSTGCIPATIGVVGGRVKIGLEESDLNRLADVNRTPRSVKISRRDIAPALALKADGGAKIPGTTISATLIFAALAGIKVFATGGLGGVHRGGETSMDISADLMELTRCPVGLVSAGAKSILDIGRTLEYLETLGVPVIPYSNTKEFPAFFSPRSGYETPWNVNDPVTAAKMLFSQWQLGFEGGALIAAPIPDEYAEKGEAIQRAVSQAVRESEENGMSKRGKDVTPWLLSRVAELTKSDSIESNIALLENCALIVGWVQILFVQTSNRATKTYASVGTSPPAEEINASIPPPESAKVLVVGSAALDITARAEDMVNAVGLHSTSSGTVTLGLGGVARNIAEACHRMGEPALLVAPVGEDTWGRLLIDETKAIGMRTDGFIQRSTERTAVCNLFLDGGGSLIGGVADMDIATKLPVESVLERISGNNPELVAFDGNLSEETIQTIVEYCAQRNIASAEPTSIVKSERILPAIEQALKKSSDPAVTFFTPNLLELKHVYSKASTDWGLTSSPFWWSVIDRLALGNGFRTDMAQLARKGAMGDDALHQKNGSTLAFLVDEGIVQMATALTPFFRHMFIKCGEQGVVSVIRLSGKDAQTSGWIHERSNPSRRYVVAQADSGNEILIFQHTPAQPTAVLNSTGAGDSFVGAILASLQVHPHPLSNPMALNMLVTTCQKAASLTLQTHAAVSPLLNTLVK
ncbi:indigoidine synthase A-like protein [Mycena metata]|uniref:Indigoidine synthase A-like protein n=1 Tax=Mycena metata TaxID=1033252 RepID=A0AAD7KJG2_9AGAR|nr:indigoidine synthase A-like protein [Mycena metata]